MANKKSKGVSFMKIVISFFLLAAAVAGYMGYDYYKKICHPNVSLANKKTDFLYIPTGADMEDVANLLYEKGFVINRSSFLWVAEKKNYRSHVHPGKYLIKHSMSNDELINLLRSGEQVPVDITFNNLRLLEDLPGRLGAKLEFDSLQLASLLKDESVAKRYGFNKQTFKTMFIPNTYRFNWNTSAEEFLDRMAQEYKKFWNEDRKAKAKAIGLSQSEVTILASIVQAEQQARPDERPKIAGLYLNRIKKGMLLQSDPTLVYALGDFTVKRVLNKDKAIESPYNTYKYPGLPPGPINIPDPNSIDAVLNAEKHDYIFMCAKEDFSGYHNFAKTNKQHEIYAAKYHAALNKQKILR
jgi:UPF0755 protein